MVNKSVRRRLGVRFLSSSKIFKIVILGLAFSSAAVGIVSARRHVLSTLATQAPVSPGGFAANGPSKQYVYTGLFSPLAATAPLAPTPCTPPSGLIISEFRSRGPSASNDEFVELYNNTDAMLTVCTADGSSGWAVASSEGTVRFVVPVDTVIPARSHYLAAGSAYSLSGYAAGNLVFSSNISDNKGIALFNTATPANFSTATRLDAAGFTSDTNTLYREGAGLSPIGTIGGEYSFARKLITGLPQDGANNAADFSFIATNGGTYGGVTAVLGAPGPENRESPIQRNGPLALLALDSGVSINAAPNRVRDTAAVGTNAALGTLTFRRKAVNNTGYAITRLRFRMADLTTLNAPGYVLGGSQTDLRVLNSGDTTITLSSGTPVLVRGTTVETPPTQTMGGGLNTSVTVSLSAPLAAGTSVNVQFVLGVQQGGSFRFFVNSEATTDTANPRLDPQNQTGGAGEDPLSRNYNWSVPLVGLPGRANLNLGLSLAYNSLVWTKNGSYISFDDDGGFPSPGFRLGFPVIQSVYYDVPSGKYAYLLITPNGERVELRQVGSSTLYESVDSSHLLLDSTTMTLRTTDGTRLSYVWTDKDYQCTEIKDRNGNFITINYTDFGKIDTIVDTLSRTIQFNYDEKNYLSSITQVWTVNGAPQTHTWASFSYLNPNLTIQTNFTGLTVLGPPNNSTLTVLSQVTLTDGSRFNFDYNTWGQVKKISNYAADSHLLNYRSYNLPPDSSTALSDGPRFTERRDWAENWNGDTEGTPATNEEVLTQFAVPASVPSWTMPDGSTQNAGTMTQVTLPDGTYHRTYSHSSGWDEGLPLLTETYDSASVRQRQSATAWTQDNTAVAYPLNPRVTEMNVYDPAGNRARTTVSYGTFTIGDGTSARLPQDVYEYQANATTVLRRTHTNYNLASAYTSRRIIGLVSEKTLHEVDPSTQAETLMSKVTFQYDGSGSIQGTDAPAQHDTLNYGAGLLAGRANLSSVKRYDVVNTAQFTTVSSKYNRAGAVVSTTDEVNHQITISYTDAFAANGTTLDSALGFVTLAYPTSITDADGYSSSLRYNYDFGAATWKQTPLPNTINNTPGPRQKMAYDSVGRLERITNLENNAYTRFEFPSSQTRVDTYATIQEGLGEAHSFKITDGHGRVIATAADHPGSDGGFSGQRTEYDTMGRVKKTFNPTETSASGAPSQWAATGDDATANGGAGWVYTQQTYDWKGRPLVTTNTDGTTKTASYGGCGCAGGQVVTLTDEGTVVSGEIKKRQQKIYADVLSRTVKTEVLNWQGGSVYSTTVNSYNARDQLTRVRQHQGLDSSSTYQDTTMTYDGHGRLKTKHAPEQDTNTATTWDYNADDTVQKVTDARGAWQSFTYNNRHLATSVTYAVPGGSTIPVPASASYAYDAAGNRKSMTDGLGTMSYAYDTLSRLESETRTFTDLGTYTLSYAYNLSGALNSITDPFGAQVGYVHDTIGRVISVTGANFGGVSSYASDIHYRASGALKDLDYGNSRSLSLTYNARQQPASFTVPGVMSKTYDYQPDGRLKFSDDLLNAVLDRSYAHDHAGRITEALSGAEARNEGPTNTRPYKQTFVYDALGHLTERPENKLWSQQGGAFSPTQQSYVNERNSAWTYDADGNLTDSGGEVDYTIDAGGQTSRFVSFTEIDNQGQPGPIWVVRLDVTQTFDGDGLAVKKLAVNTILKDPDPNETTTTTTYLLRSSALGGMVVAELGTESEQRGFVYLGGSVLAVQDRPAQTVKWEHRDAGNASLRMTSSNGTVLIEGRAELDPLGSNAGASAPVTPSPALFWKLTGYPGIGSPGSSMTCIMDFIPQPCSQALNRGVADLCPENDCGPRHIIDPNGRHHLVPLTRGSDSGRLGYYVTNQAYETDDDLWGKAGEFVYADTREMRFEPQNPSCTGPIPEAAGRKILKAAEEAGIDPTLLSVTWRHESSFGTMPKPNPRKNDQGKLVGYDVGPMQISTNYYDKDPFTKDLPKAFSGNSRFTFGRFANPRNLGRFHPDVGFNGDVDQNLRAGARAFALDILPRSRSLADAAGIYRAGKRSGPYQGRYDQYVAEWEADKKYLDCLKTQK